eukprot:sb/3474606/
MSSLCMLNYLLLLLFLSGSVSSLSITWCVYRPADITKCEELAIAYGQSSSANNKLDITCEDYNNRGGAEACWARVLADTQTITVIDAPEIYKALRAGTADNSIRGRLDPYGTLAQMEFFSWEPNIRFSRLLHPGM